MMEPGSNQAVLGGGQNSVSSRRHISGDTPKQGGGFLTPMLVNKGADQGPSMEVTPTNYLVGGVTNSGHHLISKHNSFFDECLRLNAGNTTAQVDGS